LEFLRAKAAPAFSAS